MKKYAINMLDGELVLEVKHDDGEWQKCTIADAPPMLPSEKIYKTSSDKYYVFKRWEQPETYHPAYGGIVYDSGVDFENLVHKDNYNLDYISMILSLEIADIFYELLNLPNRTQRQEAIKSIIKEKLNKIYS